MSNRSLLMLAALVVLFGAFIWFFERHAPTTDEASELAKKVLKDLTSEEIQGLEIKNQYGDFAFSKTDGHWRLTEPIVGPADGSAVDGVVASLLGLEVERTLDSDQVEADAYNLAKPAVVVTLIIEGGARRRLTVGGVTPLGGKRAISRGDREIILTSGAFVAGLEKELEDWRSRELVEARLADLHSIEIETRGDRIDAVQVDGEWHLRSPVADLADSNLLQTFLTDITGVRVEAFIDGAADLDELGLTPPRHHIMLVRGDGGESTILDFGNTREDDGATQVLCRRNGVDFFWVNDRAETVLGKAPVRWREPRVRPFETWDIDTLAIVAGDGPVTLKRTNGIWTFEDDEAVDAVAVRERLSALAELEVVDFDLMDLQTAEIARITVGRGGSGSQDLTFVFHDSLGEGGNILVQVTGRETLMSVRPQDAEPIFENLEELHPAPVEEDASSEAPEVVADS